MNTKNSTLLNFYRDFSADASVYKIMLEYLQPFELACITGAHTDDAYFNAATQGSTEYVTKLILRFT